MTPPEINWLQEGVRIGGTGIIALLGAWVGFGLANRGRKYDILYKERFNAFKVITDDILHMRYIAMHLRISASRINDESYDDKLRQHSWKRTGELVGELGELITKMQDSRKDLTLISNDVRKRYFVLIRQSINLVTIGSSVFNKHKSVNLLGFVPSNPSLESIEKLNHAVDILVKEAEATVNEAYKELKLPDYIPLFTKESYDWERIEEEKGRFKHI